MALWFVCVSGSRDGWILSSGIVVSTKLQINENAELAVLLRFAHGATVG